MTKVHRHRNARIRKKGLHTQLQFYVVVASLFCSLVLAFSSISGHFFLDAITFDSVAMQSTLFFWRNVASTAPTEATKSPTTKQLKADVDPSPLTQTASK